MSETTNPRFEDDETAQTAMLPDVFTADDVTDEFPSLTDSPPAEVADSPHDSARSTARTRWAGIVWGTIFAAVGLATMLIVTSPDRRAGFGGWAASLTPGGFVVMGVLAFGCLILVLGLLAAVRRLQRRRVAS